MIAFALGVALCGTAAYRLARALAVDTISQPLREWLYDRAYPHQAHVAQVAEHIDLPAEAELGTRPWTWLYALASCVYCVSWWAGLALWGLWRTVGWSRTLIAAAAVAGTAAILATYDRDKS